MFMPSSDSKDRILMNIIDYFIETYNTVKSNGKPGLMKEFEYRKGNLNTFQQKPNGKDTQYLAYRNTKSQKIKSEVDCKIMYNKRKLNEFLRIIFMLNDGKMKIELLKEHVYFNYEFMHAKAELREMDFVVEAHETILALRTATLNNSFGLDELIDISNIYKDHYPNIQHDPSLLVIEILSRLDEKSDYGNMLAIPTGLQLQQSFIKNETIKSIFMTEADFEIVKFSSEHEGPHVFIEAVNKKDGKSLLYVLNSVNTKVIGYFEFTTIPIDLKIVFNDDYVSYVNRLSHLKGFVFYVSSRNVNCMNFNKKVSTIQSFENDVNQVIIISATRLIVVMKETIVLLNLNIKEGGVEVSSSIEYPQGAHIQLIETTSIPKETIFSSNYFNSLSHVTVIVGLSSQLINIYKLDNINMSSFALLCSINSINWIYYGYGDWFQDLRLAWQ